MDLKSNTNMHQHVNTFYLECRITKICDSITYTTEVAYYGIARSIYCFVQKFFATYIASYKTHTCAAVTLAVTITSCVSIISRVPVGVFITVIKIFHSSNLNLFRAPIADVSRRRAIINTKKLEN